MSTDKTPKNPTIYNCDICDFMTSNRKDYSRHVATLKHQKHTLSTNDNSFTQNTPNKFICSACNKCYKERTGLWRHNQICQQTVDASHNFVIDKELVMSILKQNADIIKENSELKNMMMEVMGGIWCVDAINENKIIKRISKEILVEKEEHFL